MGGRGLYRNQISQRKLHRFGPRGEPRPARTTGADALTLAQPGDWLLLQNETNAALTAVQAAKAKG